MSTLFNAPKWLSIAADEYIDRMKAGWLGQMVGVGWGASTEFRYVGSIMPKKDVPVWRPEMVNPYAL